MFFCIRLLLKAADGFFVSDRNDNLCRKTKTLNRHRIIPVLFDSTL